MADVSKIDIDGVQWDIKDSYIRNYVIPNNSTLKTYIKNQNILSAPETITGGTTQATAITADYDGFISVGGGGGGTQVSRGVILYIKPKNANNYISFSNYGDSTSYHIHNGSITVPINKGDTFYATYYGNRNFFYGFWYKDRDYS